MSDTNNETQEIGAIEFQDANQLFNLLLKQWDLCEDNRGIALYKLKGTDKGRVIFSGTELDKSKWEKIAENEIFSQNNKESIVEKEDIESEKKLKSITVYFS